MILFNLFPARERTQQHHVLIVLTAIVKISKAFKKKVDLIMKFALNKQKTKVYFGEN